MKTNKEISRIMDTLLHKQSVNYQAWAGVSEDASKRYYSGKIEAFQLVLSEVVQCRRDGIVISDSKLMELYREAYTEMKRTNSIYYVGRKEAMDTILKAFGFSQFDIDSI